MADEIVFTVPLSDAYAYKRTMRAKKSMAVLTAFLSKHMKVEEKSVKIDAKLNDFIWSHGIKKPPHKVKVKVKREADGRVSAMLLEEAKPAPAAKPAAKPKKAAGNGKAKEKPVK